MKNISFRKPFYRLKKEDLGRITNAIVTYGRFEWKQNTRIIDTGGERVFTMDVKTAQYKYYLRIDLWLVVFERAWLGREDLSHTETPHAEA